MDRGHRCTASYTPQPLIHPRCRPPLLVAGWWGEKRFCSAGCLEGLDQAAAEAARQRMTFDEDDQVGLGLKGRPQISGACVLGAGWGWRGEAAGRATTLLPEGHLPLTLSRVCRAPQE